MSGPSETDYLKPFIESTIAAAARFRRVLIVMITASILAFGAFWNSLDETWFNSRIAAARSGEAYLSLKEIRYRLKNIEEDLSETRKRARQEVEENERKLEREKRQLLDNAKSILKERFDKGPKMLAVVMALSGPKMLAVAISKDVPLADMELPETQVLSLIPRARARPAPLEGMETPEAQILGEELNNLESEDYENARRWISRRMIPDREQATQYVQKLEEARTENVLLINLPFFGIVFDVNALGLWGGITFTVMLLIFRFSLWREYNNLRLTFIESKPEHLQFCYRSLAMEQVLTVPPALSQRQPHLKPLGIVVQGLYFLPFIIQLLIILNDLRTGAIGRLFGSKLTQISTGGSLVFLGFIGFLTVRCLQLSRAIDKEWNKAAVDIRRERGLDAAVPVIGDPILQLGERPVSDDVEDASENQE